MKHTDEKRQDLLLDALSCIDDDILAKGLALRDRETAAKAATVQPPLFDLAELDRKPPRRSPRRAILVAAAALILFSVIPLSMWLVASHSKDAPGGNSPTYGTPGDSEAAADTAPMSDLSQEEDIPNAPGENPLPVETDMLPEVWPSESSPELEPDTEGVWWGDEETMGIEINPPEYEDKTEETTREQDDVAHTVIGGDMEWDFNENYRDGFSYIGGHGSSFVILQGMVLTDENPQDTVSLRDQMALKLIGQWFYSVYTLHYDQHFPLFADEALEIYVLPQFAKAGKTYTEGVAKIIHTAEETAFFQSLSLYLSLIRNEALEGSNREEYLRQFALYHPDSINTDEISAVRKIQIAEDVEAVLDGRFQIASENIPKEFYCYEYRGRWYLDTQDCLEDDLSMDLLEADPESSPYYKTRTITGVITDRDEEYLYVDGLAILIHGLKLPPDLLDNSTVTVTYHGLGAKFLLKQFNQPSTKTVTQYMGDSVTVITP